MCSLTSAWSLTYFLWSAMCKYLMLEKLLQINFPSYHKNTKTNIIIPLWPTHYMPKNPQNKICQIDLKHCDQFRSVRIESLQWMTFTTDSWNKLKLKQIQNIEINNSWTIYWFKYLWLKNIHNQYINGFNHQYIIQQTPHNMVTHPYSPTSSLW